jgi:Ulp1 family protease
VFNHDKSGRLVYSMDTRSLAAILGLRDDGQLKDIVINYYFDMLSICENENPAYQPRVLLMSTHFSLWENKGFNGVDNWLQRCRAGKPENILAMEAIIFLVLGWNNWSFGVINITAKQFEAYDFLFNPDRNQYVFQVKFPLPLIVCSSSLTSP